MNLALRLSALSVLLAGAAHLALAQTGPVIVSPASVVFCGKPGQLLSSVPVSISTSSGSLTFLATSVTSDGNWLTADPAFATATTFPYPQLVLGFNSAFIPFATGSYRGQVVLATFDGAKLATIPVLLQVSAEGCGAANTGALFGDSGPFMIQLPPGATGSYQINIYNTYRTNVAIVPNATTTTGQNWISVIKSSNLTVVTGQSSPTPFYIGISAAGLGAVTYPGTIELASSSNVSLYIPITLVVNPSAGDARLVASPSPLSITMPAGTVSSSAEIKLINITTAAVSIAVTANSDRQWLSVTPASAVLQPNSPTSLTVTMTGAGLLPGANKGSIHVQVTSGAGGSMDIPVKAGFETTGELSAPGTINITTAPGATAPVTQTLTVSTAPGVSSVVSLSTAAFSSVNQPWLSVTPYNPIVSPGTPVNLTVSVLPGLLPAGPAVGAITLKPVDGSAPLTIPVNVNAGLDAMLSVAPGLLSFTYQAGGVFPQNQTFRLTSTAPNGYAVQASTATGGNWLSVNPASSGTPATITAQVDPSGLAPNIYKGQIAIVNTNSGGQQIVPVTLTVGQPLMVSANPAALSFTYQAGGTSIPQAQSVQLAAAGGSAVFTSTASGLNGAPNFLTVNASSGSTPATLTVGVNAAVLATLAAGQYSGMVAVSSPGIPGSNQAVAVSLVVLPFGPQPQSIVSSASLQPGPVSPGELVTIFGVNLGPADGVGFALTSQGSVPSQLGSTTVSFDGIPSPLLYAGPTQINAIVPYEIAGRTQTNLVVARDGAASSPLPTQIVDTVPAIFSATQTGRGQGAILNADGTLNGPANPAPIGSVIQIFATGEGAYPGALSGSVTPSKTPFALFPAPVSVTVGGQPAEIRFVGEAPGLISGILQVNAVVPLSAGSGPQQVVLSVGQNNNSLQSISVVVE